MTTQNLWQKLCLLSCLLFFSMLLGCSAGQPLEGSTTADDIPEGPGVFSGEGGEFIIYKEDGENKP